MIWCNSCKQHVGGTECERCKADQSVTTDDLLPFREAARLGCKDFKVAEYGTLVFISAGSDQYQSMQYISGDKARQAAACAYWFWTSNPTNEAPLKCVDMLESICNWAAKHCAPEKKEEPYLKVNNPEAFKQIHSDSEKIVDLDG